MQNPNIPADDVWNELTIAPSNSKLSIQVLSEIGLHHLEVLKYGLKFSKKYLL